VAQRHAGKAQPDVVERRPARDQRAPRVLERSAGADRDDAVALLDPLQLVDGADEEQRRQRPEHLVDPQADVGRAGEDARVGMLDERRGEVGERARREERRAGAVDAAERWIGAQLCERADDGLPCRAAPRAARTCARRRRRSAGSRCSGRGFPTARRRGGAATAFAACHVVLVRRPERHHEPRRAEAALRRVAVDHRLLHRMERAVAPCAGPRR
jgi:hypothetical protein